MNALVTGSNGFVGNSVCEKLQSVGIQVTGTLRRQLDYSVGFETAFVGDIGSRTSWHSTLEGVDVVVHLAARVHQINDISSNPLNLYREVNVEGTKRLATSCIEAGVKRLIFASSIKVNGENTNGRQPFSESDTPAPAEP
ncbi:MAG: NAD-dependent epimerase/dehydratase family protein [Planctomycetota bacterium]